MTTPEITEKTFHCKHPGCDFSTTEIRKLISHYSSVHSWHHREKETKSEETVTTDIPSTLREFMIWGDTYCSLQNTPRRMCGHCWQELKEEAIRVK